MLIDSGNRVTECKRQDSLASKSSASDPRKYPRNKLYLASRALETILTTLRMGTPIISRTCDAIIKLPSISSGTTSVAPAAWSLLKSASSLVRTRIVMPGRKRST